MTNQKAECTSCGNEWKLRKPKEEIERLRCSKCDETGDIIEVDEAGTSKEDSDGMSVIERVELTERHTDLKHRADQVAERIERLGKETTVPDELEPSHRRVSGVSDELSKGDLLSSSELDEVAQYIDKIENEIQDLDIVDEISDLELRVKQLHTEIEELEAQKQQIEKYIKYGKSGIPNIG